MKKPGFLAIAVMVASLIPSWGQQGDSVLLLGGIYHSFVMIGADKQITKISQYSLKELGYIHTESLSKDTWDELKAIVDQFYAK